MRRLHRAALAVAVMVAVLMALAGIAAAVVHRAAVHPPYTGDDDVLTILVIGSDIGPPERPGDPLTGRADAIHILAIDPEQKAVTVVDIPRDSVVGGDKINAYLATGGPEGLRDALSEFSGIPIDYWALTSFQGFIDLVEDNGGIEVVVDVELNNNDAKSNIQPGLQTLNGADALAFARDRKSLSDGDFGRTRHQGELLIAAHDSLRDRNLIEVARLGAAFLRNTFTDIPREELLGLALLSSQIEGRDILQESLTGAITTQGSESVVLLEPGDVFETIAAGQVGPDTSSTDGDEGD